MRSDASVLSRLTIITQCYKEVPFLLLISVLFHSGYNVASQRPPSRRDRNI